MRTNKTYTVDEATKVLEHFCAYQERSHKEIEKKLRDLKMIPQAQEQIILHLLQHNFLNEERFAKAFTRGKFYHKNWGKLKIIRELKFREISAYNIKSALLEINEDDYLKTLDTLATKKLALIKESNIFKKQKKLSNYLISKGFEFDLVYKKSTELI